MCLAVYLREKHCSGAECGIAVCNVLELSVVQVAAYLRVVHCTRGERDVTVGSSRRCPAQSSTGLTRQRSLASVAGRAGWPGLLTGSVPQPS